jgi:hypothetical protein
MNGIVAVCKSLSDQVDAAATTNSMDDAGLKTIQRQYGLALHHLVAACKGYVHGSGLYPLSLLHASASHLTHIVIELVQRLGVCH